MGIIRSHGLCRYADLGFSRDGAEEMSIYKLSEAVMQQALNQAGEAGYSEQEMARALMAEVLAVYKQGRTQADIAHELQFLAENLDEDQDYAFMRP